MTVRVFFMMGKTTNPAWLVNIMKHDDFMTISELIEPSAQLSIKDYESLMRKLSYNDECYLTKHMKLNYKDMADNNA